jgi:Flp pilus assembly protein TadD
VPSFESHGLNYSVERRDGRVFHQETRRNADGQIVATHEEEILYVLGSGRQGISYLVERGGFLFESPITWFSRKKRWDLSPGFEVANYHFDRPIRPGCLYCHANRANWAPGPINRYRLPIFEGHAIGCERCHGPGELHAADPAVRNGLDQTIVNPVRLEPSLRDAVCEQCHLIGNHRVVRIGRREEDFRPGLPFQWFWTVLTQPADRADSRFVGQVEQMHASRCFTASQGRLGCISCHDPHRLPSAQEKVAFYRSRCLECHGDRGCTLPAATRLERSPDDDCTSCHMPREANADIPHAASANHSIPRNANRENSSGSTHKRSSRPSRRPVPFHGKLVEAQEQAELGRDIGVALCRGDENEARFVLPLLDAALIARPDDVAGWEAKGFVLGRLGRNDEALTAFQKALSQELGRESTLVGAAYLTAQMGRNQDAIAFWHRAIAINPWRSDYLAELALIHFREGNWQSAAAACRETLELNPFWVDVRKWLVRCYLELGDAEAARSDHAIVLGFEPIGPP